MQKSKQNRILALVIIISMMFQTLAFAVPGVVERAQYIYFEDSNSQMVVVDYMKAIDDAIHGDSTLYNSIKNYVGIAEATGKKIIVETDAGTILDYQKAMIENKVRLVQIKDDVNYSTAKPDFTQELKVVNGTAAVIAAATPSAPSVTNDDELNTVSGMTVGMEYNLNGIGYVAYDQAVFDALDFSGAHTLLVRVSAVGTTTASPVVTLTFTPNPVTPPAPAVTNDDELNTVSGMAAGMEYNLNGAGYVAYNQIIFDALDFSGDHTLLVRYSAEGINPFGPDTTLIFTTNPLTAEQQAELAVSQYETAPINTLADITAAETLKAPADLAAAAVAVPILRAAFEQRISDRAALIINAKAAILAADATAQASAEAAVTALESAPVTTIAEINTAAGLKTTAETKVALVADVVAKEAFTNRIMIKFLEMAISEFNLITYYGSMNTAFTKYQAVVGLDLTDYNNLSNKVPIQTAMLTPVFTSASHIKSSFDSFVAQQMVVESSILGAFNNAVDEAAIATAIATHATTLSLDLTAYNALSDQLKFSVHTALLSHSFTNGQEIKLAFLIAVINNAPDAAVKTLLYNNANIFGLQTISEYQLLSTRYIVENAIIAAKPIADKTEIVVTTFNSTVLSGYIGQLIPINADLFGLDLTDFNKLTFRNQMTVHNDLLTATLTSAADVQNVFNASVATQKALESTALAAFNNAQDAAAIGTAITTYFVPFDLGHYDALADKVVVQETLLAQTFPTFDSVVKALNEAVTNQENAQKSVMTAMNNAATITEMSELIIANATTLGLDLTEYNTFTTADKDVVLGVMLSTSYYSVSVVKSTFDLAVKNQKAVIEVNMADSVTMGSVLTSNATVLGLNLSDYNLLTDVSKAQVEAALIGKAFTDKNEVNSALEAAVSIPIINEITTDVAMGTAINRYRTILGLDLTGYYTLYSYKTSVHNALMMPVFTQASEVKTAFDDAVGIATAEKAIAEINAATTAMAMNSLITKYYQVLGLDLTYYNVLSDKLLVQTALLSPVFTTAAGIQTVFDEAVAIQEVNEASSGSMGSIIVRDAPFLGLTLTDYNILINKESVHATLEAGTYATSDEIQIDFDAAVASQKAIEEPLWGSPGVKLDRTAITLATGSVETLTATVFPVDTPNTDVTWSSDNEGVATVDNFGNVTAIGEGTATITVTTVDTGYQDTCDVTVYIAVTGVSLSEANKIILLGSTVNLNATVSPADATNKSMIWTSANPNQITVDSSGNVTGVAVGIATTITVTTVDGGYSDSCSVRVVTERMAADAFTQASFPMMASTIETYGPILGLDLTGYNALTSVGKSAVQSALLSPVFTTAAEVQSAIDSAVAAQSALAGGAGVMGNLTVTITTPSAVSVTGINVTGQSGSTVANGSTLQMKAEILPINATDSSVTWSVTSGTGVAEIDPDTGLLTPTAEGTVTVTAIAKDGSGIEGSLVITITAP